MRKKFYNCGRIIFVHLTLHLCKTQSRGSTKIIFKFFHFLDTCFPFLETIFHKGGGGGKKKHHICYQMGQVLIITSIK